MKILFLLFQMRRRRLARLAGLETSISTNSSSNSGTGSISPGTPGPSRSSSGPIMSPPTQQLQHPEAPMEVEDSSDKQFNTSGVDVDSGIENMEVEDSDRKELAPRSRVHVSAIYFVVYLENC